MSGGVAHAETGEELSLKAPAVGGCQLEFCLRNSQFLPSDCFSVLWTRGESVVVARWPSFTRSGLGNRIQKSCAAFVL